MGAVGGSAFHLLKGLYNSPKGHRFNGGIDAVRMNAPRVGGSFAVWGGLFSTFDCTMVYVRQKEDPWNSILAGAATGGFLQMRQGLGPAARSAVFGGVFLGLIEGAGIMLNKFLSAQPPMDVMVEDMPQQASNFPSGFQLENRDSQSGQTVDSSSLASWFGELFGGKQEEPKANAKSEVLREF